MSEPRGDATFTCEAARLLLNARPDTKADRAGLAEHLSACAGCSAYQDAQRTLDAELANVLVMEPPAWLTNSILEQLSPERSIPWWARPRISLALQWSFYILLSGGLALGLLLPLESVSTWFQAILTMPSQLSVAVEVLMSVIGLIPLDPIASVLDDASWLYESAALALVFWWLRQGSSAAEPRSHA